MNQYSHLYEFLKEKREKNECKCQNFPNMGKKRVNVVQEVQRVSGKINPRRNMPKHTVIKWTNI